MINETDQIFISGSQSVKSIPQDDTLLGEIPIKEYIDFDSPEWSMFSYKESNTAFEIYGDMLNNTEAKVANNTYNIVGPVISDVIGLFFKRLASMKTVALTKQRKLMEANEGELIFQSRTMVNLFEQPDGMIRLRWRGKLDRIPSEQKTRGKRIPFGLQEEYRVAIDEFNQLVKEWVVPINNAESKRPPLHYESSTPHGIATLSKRNPFMTPEQFSKEFQAALDALNLKTIPQGGGKIFQPGDVCHVKITGQPTPKELPKWPEIFAKKPTVHEVLIATLEAINAKDIKQAFQGKDPFNPFGFGKN